MQFPGCKAEKTALMKFKTLYTTASPYLMDDRNENRVLDDSKGSGIFPSIAMCVAVLGCLLIISWHNYLLFHSIAEIISVAVSTAVFLLVWNSRHFARNTSLVVLGLGYLCVGIIDLIHLSAYKGMGVFVESPGADLSIQLGLAGRMLHGFSLLMFSLALGKRWSVRVVVAGYVILTGLLLASILWWQNFPSCFIEGSGLTSFKKSAEYSVCFLLFLSFLFLSSRQKALEITVYRLIAVSIFLTIGVEIFLTLYVNVYGLSNLISHCLKITSFFLIYMALIRSSLTRPYTVLFREMGQIAEELREKEERFRHISSITSDIAYSCMAGPDHNYSIHWISGAVERIFGYSTDEIKAMGCWRSRVHEDDVSLFETYVAGLSPGSSGSCELRLRHKSGQIIWAASYAECVKNSGQPQQIYGGLVDITERKNAEKALRESEEKYRILFHNELYAISIIDLETLQFLDVNDAHVKLYGYSKDELRGGITALDLLAEHQESADSIDQIISHGTRHIPLFFHKKKDGTVFPVEIVEGPYIWRGKNAMFALVRDISERRQTEEALKEIHRRLDAIIEFFPDATFVIDAQGKVTHWNRAIEEMTGVLKADILGKGGCEYAVSFYGTRRLILIDYATAITSGIDLDIKGYDLIQREGDWFLGEAFAPQVFKGRGAFLSATASVLRDGQGDVIGAIESIRDVTDRKQAEEDRVRLERQVLQAQKLESLGRMAGAISHHFNNMLGIVIGNLELAMDDVVYASESNAYIAQAMKASQRAAEMSRLMLTYLGQTIAKKERLDLARAIGDSQSLFTASIPANVHLKTEFSSRRVMIHADGVHIQQILTNLVSNAVEAIGEAEGRITVAVDMASVEKIRTPKFFPVDWNPKESSYACLSVADSGPGLDTATIEKIFDPFYTTKFTGRGLGLPVVLGLVRVYEGAVTVESNPGEGAVFRVYFPVVEHEGLPSETEEQLSPQIKGGGLVLVVDDEPMVRNMARTMLERRLGYQVIVAGNGHEALEIFRAQKDAFHLVLLDLSMPGMNGWQTLAAIREIQPTIPVILASGFDEAQVMQEKHSELPHVFLHKPYHLSDLRSAISFAENH